MSRAPRPGADVVRGLATLTVIAPVQAGREDELARALDALGQGPQSPFATVPGTHLARLLVIDHLPYIALRRHHLLFGAVFDGPWEAYLPAVHATLEATVERIWGHCAGFPAGADSTAFQAWMLARRIPARAVVAAYPQATLEEVREALALRRRIGTFAARWQGRAPGELQAAFREEFATP